MDLIKIGKFIADCRKEKKITQSALAEKLMITDRAVSKWERGLSLPDADKMLDLCEILNRLDSLRLSCSSDKSVLFFSSN